MKIGIFADTHCADASSFGAVRSAFEMFRAQQVDCIVCLGDMVVNESKESDLACITQMAALFAESGVPYYVVPGNHDYIFLTPEELFGTLNAPKPPYAVETPSHRLIFLDGNFASTGEHFSCIDPDWTDTRLPQAQVDFLADALASSQKPCIVFCHELLDEAPFHTLKNAAEVRAVLEQSGKVQQVFQGHFHPGQQTCMSGILYTVVPALFLHPESPCMVIEV